MSEKSERKLLIYQKPEEELTIEQAEAYYAEFLKSAESKASYAHFYSDFPSPPSYYFRSMLILYSLAGDEKERRVLADTLEYLALECIPDDVEHEWLKIAADDTTE